MNEEEEHACHAKEAETRGASGTAGRTSNPLGSAHAWHAEEAVHIVPRLPRKRSGDPRDARAYIRPLGSAHCATPATQKRRRPKGRQGVHPSPWQCTLCRACHAKEAETQGTPGRTSDPLAVHIVPRLPRKRGGDPRDARAYIRPLGSAHCATQKSGNPRDARAYIRPLGSAHCATPAHAKEAETQGTPGRTSDPLAVHIVPRKRAETQGTPGRTSGPLGSAHCATPAHATEAETQGTPGRTSDPLAMHIVPRLPRKRGGDPRDARAYIRPLGSAHCATPVTQKRRRGPKRRQGVHPTPWQCTLCHACHAKERRPKGRQGVHPTPWQCTLCHACPRNRSGDPRDARAYIRPLGSAHGAMPATQKRRRPKGREGVHPTPWQCTLCHACHAKEAETQGTPGRTSDPLAMHIVPCLPRKRAETQGTRGRTSDPLAVHIVPRLPRKRGGDPRDARAYIRALGSAHCATPVTQKRRRPKGRQGVHPTPWQCALCHACHAKEAETQGTRGRTSDPLAVHIVPRLPRKRGGDPRDARAYIRPLGNAHCAMPGTQKRRRPKGREGVHPTPWQCTLCHACHAKEAETQGTPGRTSEPLAVHIVPRLSRKRGGDIRPLGSAHCATPATQKRRRPKGRQGVHPTPWQCHTKEAETQGTPGRTSDPLAGHIVPRLPRKRGGDPRDARAYIRPLGSAHCATPAHATEAETQGTPGRTSDPLAVHIVPCLPRKRGGDPRDARAYIRPLGSAHCATPATQKRRRPKGRQGVHPTPWQCTLCHACHAKEAETQGTPGRTSDPLAVHIVTRLPRKRGGDPSPTPWQCTLCHACHAKEAETQGTPGRTSE